MPSCCLTPAVVPDGTFGLVSFRGIAGGNSFLTDGNDTTNQFYNENAGRTRITTQISQDAVQEFQVLSNGYSAEYGRASGGVINTVTRCGGNDIHGTGYWFFRNRTFNARDPYATFNPPEERAPVRRLDRRRRSRRTSCSTSSTPKHAPQVPADRLPHPPAAIRRQRRICRTPAPRIDGPVHGRAAIPRPAVPGARPHRQLRTRLRQDRLAPHQRTSRRRALRSSMASPR